MGKPGGSRVGEVSGAGFSGPAMPTLDAVGAESAAEAGGLGRRSGCLRQDGGSDVCGVPDVCLESVLIGRQRAWSRSVLEAWWQQAAGRNRRFSPRVPGGGCNCMLTDCDHGQIQKEAIQETETGVTAEGLRSPREFVAIRSGTGGGGSSMWESPTTPDGGPRSTDGQESEGSCE